MDERRLNDVPLFADLSKKERAQIASCADEVDVAAGKELVHEGAYSYEFFVIEDGEAEVLRHDEHLADIGPGDFFGEMGILGHAQRNATVVARSPLTAIVITDRGLRKMEREMPHLADRLKAKVEERTSQLS
jgi:CRP/FNR family transcriptional regulator, cyclic AMP receptor protein